MRVPSLMVIGLAILFVAPGRRADPGTSGAPETFSANVQIKTVRGRHPPPSRFTSVATRPTSIARRSRVPSSTAGMRRS